MYNPIYNHLTFFERYKYTITTNQKKGMNALEKIFKDSTISPLFELQQTKVEPYTKYTNYMDNLEKSIKELNQVSRNLYNSSHALTNAYENTFNDKYATSSSPNIAVRVLNGAKSGTFEISVTQLATESIQKTNTYHGSQNFETTTGLDSLGSFSIINNTDPTRRIDIDLQALGIHGGSTVSQAFHLIASEINNQSNASNLKFEANVIEDAITGNMHLEIKSTDTGISSNFSIIDTKETYYWNRYEDIETILYSESGWTSQTETRWNVTGYEDYSYDPVTGTYSPVGTEQTFWSAWGVPRTVYQVSADKKSITRLETNATDFNVVVSTQTVESTTIHSQGAYKDTVVGYFDDFTDDTLNPDGYWYDRGGLTPTQDIPTFFTTANYTAGVDAHYSIDGENKTSSKNTVTFNDGYGTLELLAPVTNATITVGMDIAKMEQNISHFIQNFNKMTSFLKDNENYVRSDLKPFFNSMLSQKREELESIGISVNEENQMSIDYYQLNNALKTDVNKVKNVFINSYRALATESMLRTDSIINTPLGSYAKENIFRQKPSTNIYLSYETMAKNYTNSLIFEHGIFLNEKF